MHELDDIALLRQYSEQNSEEAFAALVTRHIDKVYSVALRHTGNPHSAEEITQAVFVILARKSRHVGKRVILEGWLYQTARLTAMTHIRSEIRRARREQEAHMQTSLNENDSETWTQIAPLLDAALAGLNETDRHAVVLRFFYGKSLREIGTALGGSEDTARMRINRAIEKLQKFFLKRGIASTTATLAGAISANSVQAAPMALAKSVTAVAIAKGAAASGSTLTIIKGALKIMAWTKMKTAIVVGVVALLATGTATLTIHEITKPKFNPNDFWATSYPKISGSPEVIQLMTNIFGHQLDSTLSASPVQLCSISGLLNQCMEISGWHYLIDKNVAAGSVKFGSQKEMTGKEWVAAFENVLQTGTPEWWDAKKKGFRKENLVLIRYPNQKIVLVLPKDKAAKYQ
jgi:RNA polymerase sigma factor (sigma-70 family)